MTKLNIEFLISTSIDHIILNIDTVFEHLLQEIRSYLNLDFIYSQIKINFCEDVIKYNTKKEDIFNIGVRKTQKNNFLIIYFSSYYKKFARIILLREAYKIFIPSELQEKEIINIFINQKIEIDLENSEYIEDWKEFKRKRLINYDFMEAEFDRLEHFLKQESKEIQLSPFQFFFSYIRRNIDLIEGNEKQFFTLEKKGFYDKIFKDYTLKYTDYPDEMLETIRIIKEIFYNVKSYYSLLDYQHYFQKFKESGAIKTYLSLRKFTENMQWIKNNTNIAPTYQINWYTLGLVSILCFMKFHPLIEVAKIFDIIKKIPFFTIPAFSKFNFGIEVTGYFILPEIYKNDLNSFLEKLETEGYLIEKKLFIIESSAYTTNLNRVTSKNIILNPNRKGYKKQYENYFSMDYKIGSFDSHLSLLDWFLIDRIRYFSITGLGFERKSETLYKLKSDLLNEIESQRKLINEIKENINQVNKKPELKNRILNFINKNQSYGFFHIKQKVTDYTNILDLIDNIIDRYPSINSYFLFQDFVRKQGISKNIGDNILLNNFKKNVLRDLFSLSIRSKKNLEDFKEDYRVFSNIFKSFYDLKIFDLKAIKSIIKDNSLIQKIYHSKQEKLQTSYESYKIYKITHKLIEKRLEDFLNNQPPVIQPHLLNSIMIISHIIKFYPLLILKDTLQTRESIEKIKWLFPRVIIVELSEYKTLEKHIYIRLQMPNLKLKKKRLLFSIFYNLFKKNLIICKSYLYSGFLEAFSRKDFYDLEREDFFYTKDLFKQFYLYVQKKINKEVEPISDLSSTPLGNLWANQKFIFSLINKVDNRIYIEHFDLNFSNLSKLLEYNKNLDRILFDLNRFKISKNENFFKNYIKAINFIPSFQSFGFGQYFVYFYPKDLNQIDFKHFLHNSFQKIKYLATIDKSNSFLINFLWPYRNPNISLLNWLTKSKKAIQEYCLYFIKRVLQIFHFNYNLSTNEWDLDSNRFKIYFQNVLFNPDYKVRVPELKEFNIGDLNISDNLLPNSSEFQALTRLYSWKSIDIKSYLGTRNYTVINQIIELLEKKLIFPVISLKNLDLKEKIYIILPNVKKEHNNVIINIFSFFNIGFIYEIEGEYYIQGFPEEIRFENGLMIKLYLPDCQLDELEVLFDLIFEYLKIEHYIILNDLVDGKDFLKSIYGNLDFLKSYNPLKNLIWNSTDKKWKNYKLFTNKFEKIYPPLGG